MAINDWIYDFRKQARANNDQQRIKLPNLYDQAMRIFHDQPEQALQLLEEGRCLAEELAESWWVYFFDHWRVYVMDDSRKEIEIISTAIAEVRKPEYDGFPQRACLHEDLINAYLALDSRSYAEDIQAALDYMAQDLTPQVECYFCCFGLKSEFASERRKWDEVLELSHALLDVVDRSSMAQIYQDHHRTLIYIRMALAACHKQDWLALARYADAGAEFGGQHAHLEKQYAVLLAWQTFIAQKKGDNVRATELYQRTKQLYAKSDGPIHEDWYIALSAYFELQADWEQVLALWTEDVTRQANLSNFSHLFRSLVAQRRALRQLGRDTSANDAALHKVLSEFRHPEKYQAELNELGFVI